MVKKLPVLATAIDIYRLTLDHFAYAIRIAWPWVTLMVILDQPLMPILAVAGDSKVLSGWQVLSAISWLIAAMAGWCSIAVLWHRRLLRNEAFGGVPVQLNARAGSYLLRVIYISVVVAIPAILIDLVTGQRLLVATTLDFDVYTMIEATSRELPLLIGSLLVSAALIVVSLRLGVALPAAALNVTKISPSDAWSATAGNSGRILVIAFLASIPVLAVNFLLSWAEHSFLRVDANLSLLMFSVLWNVVRFGPIMLGVTLLSIIYAVLIEQRNIAPTELAIERERDRA